MFVKRFKTLLQTLDLIDQRWPIPIYSDAKVHNSQRPTISLYKFCTMTITSKFPSFLVSSQSIWTCARWVTPWSIPVLANLFDTMHKMTDEHQATVYLPVKCFICLGMLSGMWDLILEECCNRQTYCSRTNPPLHIKSCPQTLDFTESILVE